MTNQAIYELAIAKQSAKGTAAAAAAFKTRVMGGDVEPTREVKDLEETGRNRLLRTSFVAMTGAEGSPQIAIRPDLVGLLLYGALGVKSVTGAADPYTHTFTPGNSLPYFTIWRMLGDQVWEKFIDCKIGQLEMVSEAGNALSMTATIMARTVQWLNQATYDTEVAVAYSDGQHFVHHHGSGLLVVDGTVIAEMERVAVTINNNSNRQPGDSVVTDDISEGRQRVTIATRQRVAAKALELYKRLHYGSNAPSSGATPTPNVLELGAGGLDLMWRLQATPERSLRHQTNRVQVKSISGFTPGVGHDPLKAEVTYEAYDLEGSPAFQSVLKNAQATY